MALVDFHTHTVFSDGQATVRQMADAAVSKGLATLGISDHSFTPFDPDYCRGMEDERAYRQEVRAVARDYEGSLMLLCGIEQDLYSGYREDGYDYVIGSVHYVEVDPALALAAQGHVSPDGLRGFVSFDETEGQFVAACEKCFTGDYYAFAQAYFANVACVLPTTGATIVGHFDLFSKYNGQGRYFDEQDERYVQAWQAAADAIIAYGKRMGLSLSVEVNYAGVYAGYRSVPYTTEPMQAYFKEHGMNLLYSSDAHSCDAIACFLSSAQN